MGVSKASDLIQIKIKIRNPIWEHPVSSQAPNEELKDIDFLCTLKIKKESQNSEHWTLDKWKYPNQNKDAKPQSGTSSILQSK